MTEHQNEQSEPKFRTNRQNEKSESERIIQNETSERQTHMTKTLPPRRARAIGRTWSLQRPRPTAGLKTTQAKNNTKRAEALLLGHRRHEWEATAALTGKHPHVLVPMRRTW